MSQLSLCFSQSLCYNTVKIFFYAIVAFGWRFCKGLYCLDILKSAIQLVGDK